MYIDAHAHVEFQAFRSDWKDVIDRARAANIWLVNVGTQRDTSRRAIEIADHYSDGVYATVGLHPIQTERLPHDANELGLSSAQNNSEAVSSSFVFRSRGEEFDSNYYKPFALHPKVLMIGECGLDYFRLGADTKRIQKLAFEQQISLAHEIAKPLMIHCRYAYQDITEFLKVRANLLDTRSPGIVHFFTGELRDALALLDLGFYITFGGAITRGSEYDEVVRSIPLDRILSETDAPYVTPLLHGVIRNEPLFVTSVVAQMAEIRKLHHEEMRQAIWENFQRLIGPIIGTR